MVKITSNKVKKYAKKIGLFGIPPALALFIYLMAIGLIVDVQVSGDTVCAGNIHEPCQAFINFTAKGNIKILPSEDWSKIGFYTKPNIDSLRVFNLENEVWKEIDLSKGFEFKKNQRYQIKFEALKLDPNQDIKWGFGNIDPVWEAPPYIDLTEFNSDWIVDKTGIEENLSISTRLLSKTSTEFCVTNSPEYIKNVALEGHNIRRVPLEIKQDMILINKIELDLNKNSCIVLQHPSIDGDVNIKLGWNSITLVSFVSASLDVYHVSLGVLDQDVGQYFTAYAYNATATTTSTRFQTRQMHPYNLFSSGNTVVDAAHPVAYAADVTPASFNGGLIEYSKGIFASHIEGAAINSNDWEIVSFADGGTSLVATTLIDGAAGNFNDIDADAFNWTNWVSVAIVDQSNDSSFRTSYVGTSVSGVIDIDTDIATNLMFRGQDAISTAVINASQFVIAYYDNNPKNISYAIYQPNGTIIKTLEQVEPSNGIAAISVKKLVGGFVIGYCQNTSSQVSFRTYTDNGTSLSGIVDVDNVRHCEGFNSTHLDISARNTSDSQFWLTYNNDSGIYATIYNISGQKNLSTFRINGVNGKENDLKIMAYKALFNLSLCWNKDVMGVTYWNKSDIVLNGFYSNGSHWELDCPVRRFVEPFAFNRSIKNKLIASNTGTDSISTNEFGIMIISNKTLNLTNVLTMPDGGVWSSLRIKDYDGTIIYNSSFSDIANNFTCPNCILQKNKPWRIELIKTGTGTVAIAGGFMGNLSKDYGDFIVQNLSRDGANTSNANLMAVRNITYTIAFDDNNTPQFYNKTDNNATTSIVNISVNINTTNGNVWTQFSNVNYTMLNSTVGANNWFNVTFTKTAGTYTYFICSYGDGEDVLLNCTTTFDFTVGSVAPPETTCNYTDVWLSIWAYNGGKYVSGEGERQCQYSPINTTFAQDIWGYSGVIGRFIDGIGSSPTPTISKSQAQSFAGCNLTDLAYAMWCSYDQMYITGIGSGNPGQNPVNTSYGQYIWEFDEVDRYYNGIITVILNLIKGGDLWLLIQSVL